MRGLTLIETLIACAMLLVMLTAIYETLLLGMRFYQKTRDAAEIQQETLRVVAQIERALVHAASGSILSQDGASLEERWILFGSAQGEGDFYEHDPTTGAVKWQRFVLIHALPRNGGGYALVRRDRKFPANVSLPALPSKDEMVAQSDRQLILSERLSDLHFGQSSSVLFTVALLSEGKNGLTITTRVFAPLPSPITLLERERL